MGQTSSSDGDSSAIEEPAVKISPELGQKIALDYQNEELNNVWKGVQVSILDRRNQRDNAIKSDMAQQQLVDEQQRQLMAARHKQLDDRIAVLQSQFHDQMLEIEHGTKVFWEDLDTQVKEKNLPCLGPRAHW
eukprot:CAMPEP_0198144814 /NCGR_PEP_ID=MMETSP1443-20131203/18685_1 /TAXON_ID=186043 /ORGANISM="Entomoneis sp., Strain CCMP2396" /LENGTH=132 /DNA_ID=CAMNT_0043808277 /DNA_START=75 /DNA_END=470 /DNA_ORIENTATION=+